MNNRNQMLIGVVVIILGVLFLLGNLFNIDIGALFWPVLLILIGLWVIFRPRMVPEGTAVTQKFLGDIERAGPWTVTNEDFSNFIGTLKLDLRQADILPGDTYLRFSGFIGDVDIIVPEDVGVFVDSAAFVSDVKALGNKQESFLSPVRLKSGNFSQAKRRLHLKVNSFIADVDVR